MIITKLTMTIGVCTSLDPSDDGFDYRTIALSRKTARAPAGKSNSSSERRRSSPKPFHSSGAKFPRAHVMSSYAHDTELWNGGGDELI